MRKVVKVKKKPAKSPRKRIIKELDYLASHVCRKIWQGKCGICGGIGNQAHHYFGKKAYPWLRFDLDNLILLDWQCHICRVHHEGESERARDAIINRIGQDRFDQLKERSSKHQKLSLLDLDRIKEELTVML